MIIHDILSIAQWLHTSLQLYGSGWVGSGLTRKTIIGKSSQNSPILVCYVGIVYHVYSVCIIIHC